MKNSILLLLTLLLFSCSNNDPVKDDASPNEVIETNTIKDTVEKEVSVKESPWSPMAFHLHDFPKKWFLLSKEEENSEEFIINNWCEAEEQQLWIEKNEDKEWVVYVLLGQDSDVYKLIEFVATKEEVELYQVVSGYLIVERPNYVGGGEVTYNFMWNMDEQFCRFNGFFGEGSMMVSERNRDSYRTVVENCDYLHEEE